MTVQIEAKNYKSVNKCMAAFFDCKVSDLQTLEGSFDMMWADGTEESWEIQQAILDIKKRTCWAWVEDKAVFHFYISKFATMTQVVKMFGHELGHTQRPFHKSLKEEQKADKFSNVAAAAYQLAKQAMGIKE